VLREFKNLKPYQLGEQICAFSISIVSNITKGVLRSSNADFKRLLSYAPGSAAEFSAQMEIIILSEEYNSTRIERYRNEAIEILKITHSLKRQL